MRRRIVVVAVLVGSLFALGATGALAEDLPPASSFGQHVSDMAPEHAQDHGAMFGACVSAMARGVGPHA